MTQAPAASHPDALDYSNEQVEVLSVASGVDHSRPKRLWNRDFILLWQGQWVSRIGSQFGYIALLLWLKDATGSATIMGTLMMLGAIPGVILGPIGGVIADRYSRKAIIVGCDLLKGIATLGLATMLFIQPDAVNTIVAIMLALAVASGVVNAFFHPAIGAATPDLVPREKLAAANSLNQGSSQVAQFFGQGVGGWLFITLGAPLLFLIDAITYIVSAFSELFIRLPRQHRAESQDDDAALRVSSPWREARRRFVRDLKEGFGYVRERTGLFFLVIAASVMNLVTAPFAVLLPLFVSEELGVRDDWFGYLIAGFGAGAMIGFLIAGTLRVRGPMRSVCMIGSLVCSGGFLAILGAAPNAYVALAMTVCSGAMSGYFNIGVMTLIQSTTPFELRGRVFSVLSTLAMGLMPIGMGLAGVIADLVDQNIRAIFIASGLGLLTIALLSGINGDFRRFLASSVSDSSC